MTTMDKDNITRKTQWRCLLRYLRTGAKRVQTDSGAQTVLGVLLVVELLVFLLRRIIFRINTLGAWAVFMDRQLSVSLLLFYAMSVIALLIYLGMPEGAIQARRDLQKVGLVNHAGEAPVLLDKRQVPDNPKITIWEFDVCGIPLQEWLDQRDKIEAALDLIIVDIRWGRGRQSLCIYAVPAKAELPTYLPWQDQYLSKERFVLRLGESYTGTVEVNLSTVPHVLLGGSTGSGKSVLLKSLLKQSLQKGALVWVADFKGGVDFGKWWEYRCRMIYTEEDLLHELDKIIYLMEQRKKEFHNMERANIDEYNKHRNSELPRIIFACDEVAELLDRTGADNERKKLIGQIENKLSTIARQGRAFGVHLILATQRPDANVISGQIKNNLDLRICGRADNVLSQIILDNTSAADQIPKDARGRFITGDGTVFQAYWVEDEQ